MRTPYLFTLLALGVVACVRHGESLMESRAPKKALIVVTSNDRLGDTGKTTGWYLSEVTHVYYPLVEAGFDVDFASPRGGAAPMDEGSRDTKDPENARFLADATLVQRIGHTLPLSTIDPKNYGVIHIAGGHGVMWDLPADTDLQRVTAAVYERGGIVAAVCHGPAALVDVKLSSGRYLVDNRDVASFTNEEESAVGYTQVVPFLLQSKLESRGARVHTAGNWQSKVEVSERLVTGQNPQSARAVGKKIVETWNGAR